MTRITVRAKLEWTDLDRICRCGHSYGEHAVGGNHMCCWSGEITYTGDIPIIPGINGPIEHCECEMFVENILYRIIREIDNED